MIRWTAGAAMIAACLVALFSHVQPAHAADKPNIVFILADDLGYGDVKCLNPDGKIATPHIDKFASQGVAFTDAHTSSSVCTPTRYGVLTGRYNWRSRLKSGVLGGFSMHLIEDGRMTVASMLKSQGYATAAFGKWHLGMDWPKKDGGKADDGGNFAGGYGDAWKVDYTKPIVNGPNDVGFDVYFGISASLDMPPYVFIDNRKVETVPTVEREFWHNRKGPASEDFLPVNVLPRLTTKATEYIDAKAADAKAGKPFFIYMPLNAPHTPIVPDENWKGKSGISDYADFVMQVDWTVGQVLEALDRNGLTNDTLVIFTSDNGCSPSANFKQLAEHGHNPSYIFRGNKADIYEGGHRVPFIVRWPAKIKGGATCPQLICLTDFMATAADVVGFKLPDTAGEDSVSILPALLDPALDKPLREAVVHHSINGSFSIRQGQWKLELCPGSGGWSGPRPGTAELANKPEFQLFDMAADISEQSNVMADHPEVVKELTALLQKYADSGRSTPGAAQQNTGEVNIFKAGEESHKRAEQQANRAKKAADKKDK
ncbi:MAG: sulfatase-like hydrolase/transferase [Phycisphaera sp.]|nr:sulfatase-like hydrolase/transferase [Phycisphaera sp.]